MPPYISCFSGLYVSAGKCWEWGMAGSEGRVEGVAVPTMEVENAGMQ